jgi:hypothetical protein
MAARRFMDIWIGAGSRERTMTYSLGKMWSFCEVGQETILMDTARDRYLALPPAIKLSFRKLRLGHPLEVMDQEPLQYLVKEGVIVPGNTGHPITPCALNSSPLYHFVPDDNSKCSTLDLIRASAHLVLARYGISRFGFSEILATIVGDRAELRRMSLEQSAERARQIAAAFYKLNAFVTHHDQCLLRSVAMIRALTSVGVSAEMVFGVAARPFRAHCWVQYEAYILNDTLEGIQNYTPILVI